MSASSSRLRVLMVSTQFPFPPTSGFEMRVYQLARLMACSREVTLLSYAEREQADVVDSLRQECEVQTIDRPRLPVMAKRVSQAASILSPRPYHIHAIYSREMQERITQLCETRQFDLVQLESSLLCAFDFWPDTPIVLDEHNIEYEVFSRMCKGERTLPRRAFNGVEHVRFRRFERRWWQRVSGCAVTSSREERIVSCHAPSTPVEVVPNGVDLEHFAPREAPAREMTVVFNGLLEYRPNVEAARYLVDVVWPLVLRAQPRAVLKIVGRGPEADLRHLRRPNVVVTGEVPDVRPYLHDAAVVAVPLRIGGGTRLKVLEALAMGKAVVSTSLGCEGIDVQAGRHLVIADDPPSFAAALVKFFAEPGRARAFGAEGRALMERQYSWNASVTRLEALHERALARPVRLATA